jgi:transcriptional regulator with XRE-family HTH domain
LPENNFSYLLYDFSIDNDEQVVRILESMYIRDEISRCEDIEELKDKVFPLIRSQQEQWMRKISEIIRESGYTKSKFADRCGVSRVTVDKWCKGSIPKNREMFLQIGMVAGYNIEKMNQLLQRYGQYPSLYSKSLEDCVCMFVLDHYFAEEKIDKYKYILGRIKETIVRENVTGAENISTEKFDAKLANVQNEDELEVFITENIAMFSYAYHKFYAYVKTCINANYQVYSSSVYDMAEGQGWSSSLRQCVSAIRQNKWYPTRNKIISLGLHLSMDHDQIDQMLMLAHMEPLCGRNVFESVVMFILEDASLNNMLDSDAVNYDPDALCRYAREVMEELDIPELASFISELSDIEVME